MYKEEDFTYNQEIDNQEEVLEEEYFYTQYKALERKYFPQNTDLNQEPIFIIKSANKFYKLTRNSPVNEFLIRYDIAPYFWLYDSHVVKFIKNFYRMEQRVKSSSTNNSIVNFIEHYEKWVKAKTVEDKKYFAGAALSTIENRTLTKNHFIQILHATIKIFDKSFSDPATGSEIFSQTFESISKMNIETEIKNEICYYLNLFNGFSQLAMDLPEKAEFYFSGALLHKQDGINAKYYLALTDVKQSNNDSAMKRIVEIYDIDLNRIKYSLGQNDVNLYVMLCEFNIMQNIFAFEEYKRMVVDIQQEINQHVAQSEIILHFLKNKLLEFNHVDHVIPKEELHSLSIQTIDLVIHRFAGSKNLAFLSSLPLVEEKYYTTIGDMIAKIEEGYEKQVQERLNTFSVMINECEISIQQLNADIEASKTNVKIKLDKMLEDSKRKNERLQNECEDKIKNIDQQPNLNPIMTFKSGMTYNLFFAVIVLLVVGFASYSNNSQIAEISDFRSMLSSVILIGAKWGIISFIIGIVFAAIQSGSTVMERNYRKQALVRKLESIKEAKEVEISAVRKEGEELEKKLIERLKGRIKYYDNRIEDLKIQKEKGADELRKSFQEQLDDDTKFLRELIKT
jgi:hypothetical protein